VKAKDDSVGLSETLPSIWLQGLTYQKRVPFTAMAMAYRIPQRWLDFWV